MCIPASGPSARLDRRRQARCALQAEAVEHAASRDPGLVCVGADDRHVCVPLPIVDAATGGVHEPCLHGLRNHGGPAPRAGTARIVIAHQCRPRVAGLASALRKLLDHALPSPRGDCRRICASRPHQSPHCPRFLRRDHAMTLHPSFVLSALSAAFRTYASASVNADASRRCAGPIGAIAVEPMRAPSASAPAASTSRPGAATFNGSDRCRHVATPRPVSGPAGITPLDVGPQEPRPST